MFRSFEIKLQQTSTNERVASLEAAKAGVEARLAKMPDLHRKYATLVRNVDILESQKKDLETRLAEGRRLLGASVLPFTLVAAAEPPIRSSSSNAKKIAAAVFVLISGAAGFFCLLAVVADPRVRTPRELELALPGVPVLAALPLLPHGAVLVPTRDEPQGALDEEFRAAARHLRSLLPKRGARLLVVSAGHGEGASTVAANLARTLANWDETALLIDANIRPIELVNEQEPSTLMQRVSVVFRRLLAGGIRSKPSAPRLTVDALAVESRPGLSELLARENLTVAEAVGSSTVGKVEVLKRGSAAVSPDALATKRMAALVEEMSREHSVVFVDALPSRVAIDSEHLALQCDAVIFVVQAMGPTRWAIRAAAEPFTRLGCPVVGSVLTKIPAPYGPSGAVRN